MKKTVALTGLIVLLAACAGPVQRTELAEYETYCRDYARKVTYSESPDENIPYMRCMQIKGMHEVEVSELEY